MRRFTQLIAEETGGPLEALARHSQQTTRRHFGKTMRLFAPLYVSNECVNNCQYCGFSRDAGIYRTTLTVDQVVTEARHLHGLGFRNVLLVAGELVRARANWLCDKLVMAHRRHVFSWHDEAGQKGQPGYR